MNANGDRLGNAQLTQSMAAAELLHRSQAALILTGIDAERGPYALNNGFSSPTGTVAAAALTTIVASGTVGDGGFADFTTALMVSVARQATTLANLLRFDADLVSGSAFVAATAPISDLTAASLTWTTYVAITITGSAVTTRIRCKLSQVRRLTREDPVNERKCSPCCYSLTASDATGH